MTKRAVCIAVLLLVGTALVSAQRSTIQLATILPANSIWDRGLRQMGADWDRATDGRVSLRVFASGAQGDEPTIIRRLRLGTPQASAFSQPGLAEIDDAFNVFSVPFLFESDEELGYVLERMEPALAAVLADNGLVLLNWGHGGWAHLFTSAEVRSLDDIRSHKIFTTAGDDRMLQWYQRNGFDPVALPIGEVPVGLNTGLVSAVPSPPYFALLLQWYSQAPFMLDLPLGPVIGATVITERAWERLSEADQQTVADIARRTEGRSHDRSARARGAVDRRDAGSGPHRGPAQPGGQAGIPRDRRQADGRDAGDDGAGGHLRHGPALPQ